MKKVFRIIIKVYSNIFYLVSFSTLLMALVAIYGCFISIESRETILKFGLYPAIAALLDAIVWFFWAKIFKKLDFFLRVSSDEENVTDFVGIIKLLVGAFAIEIIRFTYDNIFLNHSVDWSTILVPNDIEPLPLHIFHWFEYSLKILKVYGDFLIPTTSGLATLFIAIFLYVVVINKK